MADDLKSASHEDVAEALAFALCYTGRKRVHAPSNLSSNLDRCGFVSMKKPPELGGLNSGADMIEANNPDGSLVRHERH